MMLLKAFSILLTILVSNVACGKVLFPLTLTWEKGSPDGQERYLVHVNGQFPGPELRLSYGDTVEIQVQNNLPYNSTIHFHGIDQIGTPGMDGTPGVSQNAILPGASFTYKWTATQYGSYWYHGHFSGLISDGLFGSIFIQPPSDTKRSYASLATDDVSLALLKAAEASSQTVLMADWSKFTSDQYLAAEQASGLDLFCMDSILVNGKGSVNCQPQATLNSLLNPNLARILQQSGSTVSDKGCTPPSVSALTEAFNNTDASKIPAGLQSGCVPTNTSGAVFQVSQAQGWASFNFISAFSSKAVVISIDEHPMYIYAIDGQYIQPQKVDAFQIYNGERYSVMIKLDKTGQKYTIRVANNLPDQLIAGYATLSYLGNTAKHTSVPSINYGGVAVSSNVTVLDENTLMPFNQPPPSDTVDATHILSLGRYGSNWQWTLNNQSSFALPLENISPPLLTSKSTTIGGVNNLVITTKNNTWVDIILEVLLGSENPAQPPHPIHKHGGSGYLIGSGTGPFNYSSVAEAQKHIPQAFNISTAIMRDTFTTPAILFAPAWVAMRYHVTNPGAWLLHCHIQTHVAGGMALAILDGVDAWPN